MSDMPIYRVHMASISRKKSALGLYLSTRFEIVVMYLGSILITLNDLDVSMDRSITLMR